MVGPWSLCTLIHFPASVPWGKKEAHLWSLLASVIPAFTGCLWGGAFLIYLMIKWLQHPLGRFQMTCFISWLLSSFSEGRKNSRETCWFLKSRKCVACVKPDSYLLLSTCNSLCSWRTGSMGKARSRQNLSQVFFLPPPPHFDSSASCTSPTQENMYFQGFFF